MLLIAFVIVQTTDSPYDDIRDTITVSGKSQLNVDPDKADIWTLVQSDGLTASAAHSALQLKSNKVINALKDEGIDEDDLETTSFSVHPKYRWDEETNTRVIDGFIARHSIKIRVYDLEKAGRIADVAGGKNAQVQSIQFGLTDEARDEFDAKALKLAAADAKDKAESLTSALGARLGKVISIQQSNVYYSSYPRYYGSNGAMTVSATMQTEPTQILPKDLTITSSIDVVYQLR